MLPDCFTEGGRDKMYLNPLHGQAASIENSRFQQFPFSTKDRLFSALSQQS